MASIATQSRNDFTTPAIRCPNSGTRRTTTATPGSETVTPSRLTGSRLKSLAENLWERDDPDAAELRNHYESLLEREQHYVKEGLNPFLEYDEMTKLRKKEILHKQWKDRVFEPIRTQIDEKMNGSAYKEYEKRRSKIYNDYLEHTNKKGHVFLDVIAPDEYYASALHDIKPMILKANTKRLKDPLLHQERAHNREDEIDIRCQTGCGPLTDADMRAIREPRDPLVPLGRKGIDSIRWLEEPLLSINSKDRQASRRRMLGNLTESNVEFGWYREKKVRDDLHLQGRRRIPVDHSAPDIGKDTVFVSSKPSMFAI